MEATLEGPLAAALVAAVLAAAWLGASLFRAQRQRDPSGQGARAALVEFSEHSLELESGPEVLALAGEAARAIFGGRRAIAFEPGEGSGEWTARAVGGEVLPAVPAQMRGVFAWFRHNPLVATSADVEKQRFGAMREPFRHLFRRYDLDILVPLAGRGDILAAIGIQLGRKPSPADRKLLEVFRLQSAAAYANIQLHREAAHVVSLAEELDLASSVEIALAPPADEGARGRLQWAGYFDAAGDSASDFWSAYELPDGRVAFVLGDAIVAGVGGAMISAVVKSCADVIFERPSPDLEPGRLLAMLGRALRLRSDVSAQASCTVLFFDPDAGEVTYASAGHPAPLVVEEKSGEAALGALAKPGPLLGDPDGVELGYTSARRSLSPGGAVVMYTDGLVAEGSDPRAEDRRLRRLLVQRCGESAEALRDAAVAEMRAHCSRGRARDDAALVVASLRAGE